MVPTKNKKSSGYLLKKGDKFLLLDCGDGIFRRLQDLRVDYFKINIILISHTHTDHIGDFMPLIHAQFVEGLYHPEKKRKQALNVIGPKGFKDAFNSLRKVMWPEPNEEMDIEIYEQPKILKAEGFTIKTISVEHVPWFNAIAAAVYEGKKKLVYSGDINKKVLLSGKFIDLARNADILLMDTGKPVGQVEGNHANPYEAGLFAQKHNIKHLILTHIKDGKDKIADIVKDCRKAYKGKLTIGKDLLRIKI